MLSDPSGRAITSGLDGWSDLRLIPAVQAHEVRGLEEIAALVAAGALPGDTPVVVATRRTDAPWPDVRVGVPLAVEELAAWRGGDRSVARDVVEALDGALDDFMRRVRANRVE